MADAQRKVVIDVGKQQIAAVYAKALLAAHEKTCKTNSLVEELESLVNEVLDQHPQFEQTLASRLIAPEDKEALLERVLADRVSAELLVFLKVLARHERLDCLRAIEYELHKQFNQLKGRVDVEVRVAVPLDEKLQTEITEKLRAQTGSEPVLHVVHDPELIAGLVIRIGDTVFDDSVRTRLDQTRHEMVERSVELIETKRQQLVS